MGLHYENVQYMSVFEFSSSSSEVRYSIIFDVKSSGYDDLDTAFIALKTALIDACASGAFDSTLNAYAASYDASTALYTATSASPTVDDPEYAGEWIPPTEAPTVSAAPTTAFAGYGWTSEKWYAGNKAIIVSGRRTDFCIPFYIDREVVFHHMYHCGDGK